MTRIVKLLKEEKVIEVLDILLDILPEDLSESQLLKRHIAITRGSAVRLDEEFSLKEGRDSIMKKIILASIACILAYLRGNKTEFVINLLLDEDDILYEFTDYQVEIMLDMLDDLHARRGKTREENIYVELSELIRSTYY